MTEPTSPEPDDGGPGAGWSERLEHLATGQVSARRAEARRVADSARRALHALMNTEAPEEVLHEVADGLSSLAERLAEYPNRSMYVGFAEAANSGDPHAFFDHSPMIGKANPLAPPIALRQVGDHMEGVVTFGPAYEGPPGCVHGGFVAAAFDEVLGATQSLSGTPGMTARLIVNYRSPTPLGAELRFIGEVDRVEGRKIFTLGQVTADGVVTAEAEGLFVSIDFGRFAELKAQRDGL
jgi:acyl-coenzyme A thioesterase PaaI-like protein